MFGHRMGAGLVQLAAMFHAQRNIDLPDINIANLLIDFVLLGRLVHIALDFLGRDIGAFAHLAAGIGIGVGALRHCRACQ